MCCNSISKFAQLGSLTLLLCCYFSYTLVSILGIYGYWGDLNIAKRIVTTVQKSCPNHLIWVWMNECWWMFFSFTLKKLGACKNECVGEDKFVSGGLRLPFPFNIKDDPVAPVSRSIQPSDDVTTRLGLRGRMLLSWSDFSAKWKIIQQVIQVYFH